MQDNNYSDNNNNSNHNHDKIESRLETHRRWLYFLPNIFTGLNMASGFASIMLALKGDHYKASMFLLLAVLFDSVDGRVARLTGTESPFGEQFDSMSDVISFGVAPALLFYHRFLMDLDRIGMVISFLFILSGAMRLARFNANIDRISVDYFQGLPIPLGALALVGYTLLSLELKWLVTLKYVAVVYMLFYSILMISNIPFPAFKKSEWVKSHKIHALLIIFVMMASVLLYEEFMVQLILTIYVICSFINYFKKRESLKGLFNGTSEV
ncbi:MAG: CDP-diacylglycerol--serine O-phosphatidyltransferase [Oligoflexia bacterium]|nr:CDP-diacylglycerol--serine O-phosphatidyltransferase [Oligoflexia bacterium]